ncbi:hypothetical protein N177_0356 [Lutibaculum baratangense AMV1]|uniref:PepSY domain-containing protein n=1 Tax=Lutibaculum baratangense AMV1 TaxID=631454 RepID=V4RM01_9HYPH|nr:hypothetical protein N177_0356 [Lutibaculum baratangense AMV1]
MIVMGVLIVIGFFVVVGTIVNRMGGEEMPEGPASVVSRPEIAALLGPDAEVVSAQTDSGRLALTVKTPEGIRVLLIDMRSGQIISVVGGS